MLSKNKSDTRENKNQLRKYRYLNYYKGKCEWRGNLVSQCPGVTVLRGAVRRGKEWSRWYHGGLSGLKWPHNHTHTLRRRSLPQSGPGPLPLSSTDSTLRFPVCCFQVPAHTARFCPKESPSTSPRIPARRRGKNKTKRNQTPGRWPARRFILPQRQHRFVFAEAGSQLPHPVNFLEGRVQPGRMDNVTQPDFVT